MLLFSIGNGAMNAPRYKQQRNERSAMLETAQKMPSGLWRPVQLHHLFLSIWHNEFLNFQTAVRSGA
jgi:hypothetical protein